MQTEAELREALSQRVLDALPVAVVVVNAYGTPVYGNEEAQRLLGSGVLPFAGEDVGVIHPATVDGTDEPYPSQATPLQRALSGDALRVNDMEIQHPEGPIPVRAAGVPLVDQGGRVQYAVSTFTDVSGQRRPEHARTDAEAVYLGLFNQEVNSVGLLSPDGTLIDANQQPFRVTGFQRDECIGRLFWETPWFNGAPEVQEQLKDVIARVAAGETISDESQVFTASGEERWAMRSFTPVLGASGQVRNIVVVSHNITEQRLAELRVRRLATIVEGSSEFMALTDGRNRLLHLNPAGRELLGLPAEGAIPGHVADYMTDRGREVSRNQAVPALTANGRWRGPIEFRHFSTGAGIELLISAALVPNTSGREASVAIVGQDLRH